MQLFYHRAPNVGDALNPWIFNRLLPGCFADDRRDELFVGIGSLLGLMPSDGRLRTIFSSGFAAGNEATYGRLPGLRESDHVLCVRGPLTAKVLRVAEELSVADGALLLALMERDLPPRRTSGRPAFMPHVGSLHYFDWRSIAVQADLEFVDPRDPVDKVLSDIASAEVLVTEAMHGAILAETLGVPWIAVRSGAAVNSFKWEDWASSMGFTYSPIELPMPLSAETIATAVRSRIWGRLLPSSLAASAGSAFEATVSRRRAEVATTRLVVAAKGVAREPQRLKVLSKAEQLASILEGYAARRFSIGLHL